MLTIRMQFHCKRNMLLETSGPNVYVTITKKYVDCTIAKKYVDCTVTFTVNAFNYFPNFYKT